MFKIEAALALVMALCLGGSLFEEAPVAEQTISEDAPGIYEVASAGGINLSVTDAHRINAKGGDKRFLSMGIVIENCRGEGFFLDPEELELLDSRGERHRAFISGMLKSPLKPSNILPGEEALGSVAFELGCKAKPRVLIWDEAGIQVNLEKPVMPPGVLHPPGRPVLWGSSIVGIEGISWSEDGALLKVDYILKNSNPGAVLLDDRAYGKFAVLTDTQGISYTALDYKMLGPAIPPGGTVEGYLSYVVPTDVKPRYLVFWPPNEDALVFDLTQE